MADGVIILVGVIAVVVIAGSIAVAVQIVTEAGPRVLVWPTVRHGYEIHHATRLATAPWWLLLVAIVTNTLSIMMFGHDLIGGGDAWGWWLASALIPIVIAHLIDFRRSRVVAGLSFLVVTAIVAAIVWNTSSWVPVAIGVPLVLWTFNGLRATIADRMHGS